MLPIRKIDPTTIALTSYYGKTFVSLDTKKANNSVEWISRQINKQSIEGGVITKIDPADVFDSNFQAPYIYNALANRYKLLKTNDLTLIFDHTLREKLFTPDILEHLEKEGSRIVGHTNSKDPVVVDINNRFYIYSKNNTTDIGNIYDVLSMDENSSPVDFVTINIYSKSVPAVIVLGYLVGIRNVLKVLSTKYRVIDNKKSKDISKDEYKIVFKDQVLVFSRKDKISSLLISGLLEYEKELKKYSFDDFDHKDVYFNLLLSKGLGSVYTKEIDILDKLFVDSITKDILIEMDKPQTYRGLIIEATKMLTKYEHPNAQDLNYMRIRGYERISGFIYRELANSIKQYKNKNYSTRAKIDISPYKIWTSIMTDPTIKIVEDTNPIQNLKESEVVTYVGEGGRGKESMSKKTRAYQPSDMNVISEATVDSSDVGINAYLSANPEFKNMRGMIEENKKINPTSLLSTSALLAPGADRDDPKRINFISIMNTHTIAAEGYRQPYIRTGYEYVVPNRTTDMFACMAKQDGKVISKTDKGIIVEYKDGSKKGVTIGRVYGKAEGSIYPHDIVSHLNVDDVFVKGDTIAYNTGFFEQDFIDPKRIIYKTNLTAKVALLESNQTYEDSSAVSSRLGDKLKTKTTKVKSVVVSFNQNILEVVSVGSKLLPNDSLMIIEDEITSVTSAFDEESLMALKRLSKQTPTSKYEGIVDKIEVFYHGDKNDMSVSLKNLADKSDKLMSNICRSSGKSIISGRVNNEYRVNGTPLTLDKAEIKIYITIETNSGSGDKIIFANQLKSVTGEVMDYDITTEDGRTKIDALFGYTSMAARKVNSPIEIGTTISLLKHIAEEAVRIYEE